MGKYPVLGAGLIHLLPGKSVFYIPAGIIYYNSKPVLISLFVFIIESAAAFADLQISFGGVPMAHLLAALGFLLVFLIEKVTFVEYHSMIGIDRTHRYRIYPD